VQRKQRTCDYRKLIVTSIIRRQITGLYEEEEAVLCVISGLGRGVNMIFALLGCYATLIGNQQTILTN
jgi:hypothetical protein